MEPTIYKRPHIYKSNVYKRYSIYKGDGVYNHTEKIKIGDYTYNIVKINGTKWLKENLDLKLDEIIIGGPFTGNDYDTTPRAWYYNNNENLYGLKGVYRSGLLYNGFCIPIINNYLSNNNIPFRVPTKTDFDKLYNDVSGDATHIKEISNKITDNFPADSWGGINDKKLSLAPDGSANAVDGFIQFNQYLSLRCSTNIDTYSGYRARFSIYNPSEFLISVNFLSFGAPLRLVGI